MVPLRTDRARYGGVAGSDRLRLVHAVAARGDTVAGSGRLSGGDRWRTHPRRPHRLAASPQPLRMGMAGLRDGPRPPAIRGILRRLRAGGAGNACGSPDHLPCAWAGESGVASSRTVRVASFPHGAASFETLASRSLDLGAVGGNDPGPRLPLR